MQGSGRPFFTGCGIALGTNKQDFIRLINSSVLSLVYKSRLFSTAQEKYFVT
jgi:hypothetical protein